MGTFQPGQQVIRIGAAGEIGIVVGGPSMAGGQSWYRIRFASRTESVGEKSLAPLELDADPFDAAALAPAALRRAVLEQKVSLGLGDVLYSLAASRTQLHPYQYKPLIKLLESGWRRVLVADEVGLGKTIEAGFVTLERIAREPESRVVVICPAILRSKWIRELANRFDLHFDTPGTDELIRRLAKGEDDAADSPLRFVVSYEQIRSEKFVSALDPRFVRLDLLIVDEAHRARNRQSMQSQAVAELTQLADWAMYLTATPIMTSEEDLWSLLRLLLESQFPTLDVYMMRASLNRHVVAAERAVQEGTADGLRRAVKELEAVRQRDYRNLVASQDSFATAMGMLEALAERYSELSVAERVEARLEAMSRLFDVNMLSPFFNRTRRRDVKSKFAKRIVITADVTPHEEEARVYGRLSRAIFQEYRQRKGLWPAILTLSTYRAQIASSLSGAVRRLRGYVGTRFELSDADLAAISNLCAGRDLGEGVDAQLDDSVARVLRESDPDLLERVDSKWSVLRAVLAGEYNDPDDPPIGKIVIFAFYKHSLDVIGRHLDRAGIRFVRIDGDVDSDTRAERINRFKDDHQLRVLLASQVGGEGIDLQVANTVVNWDLPWNPMQVEQRIGRVDRIGQESPVIYVVNMAMKDTIESRVVARLQRRIQEFESNIGNLEEILGPLMSELEELALCTEMSPEEMDKEHERILEVAQNALKHQRDVEKNVDAFLGQEQFLSDRVGRLKAEGRFVSGPELREYVQDRLGQVDPESSLHQIAGGNLYELVIGPVMKQRIRSCMPRANKDWLRFLTRVDGNRLRACFPVEGEEAPQDVELLSVNHPLVRTISKHLPPTTGACLYCVGVLERSNVAAGTYLLLAAVHEDRSRKGSSSLISAAVPIDGGVALHPHDSDELLVKFLDNGAASDGPHRVDRLREAHGRAQKELTARVAEVEQRQATRAAERRARNLAIIEAEFDQALSRIQQKLDELFAPGVAQATQMIAPVYRSKVAKLRAAKADRLAQEVELSKPDWHNRDLAIVSITVKS
jgi:superfamily II DNA or RNA helicase